MSPSKTSSSVREPWAVQQVGGRQTGKGVQIKQLDILDIRRETVGISILDEIRKGLHKKPGEEKRLPTLLLYDEVGLQLFEKITYLDQYYLTNAEIDVLEQHADRIAERIASESIIVELGSGNLRKVNIILQALERAQKRVDYYALDLDRKELERTIAAVPQDYQYVKVKGLHGTYDDGAEWLKESHMSAVPKCILSLGSSIGNFSRQGGADFVKQFADILNPNDTVLIGMDGCKDPERVWHAYNDRDGVTHDFITNGLKQANTLLETEAFDLSKWRAIGEFDEENGRHQAFVSPVDDVHFEDIQITRDERVRIEESHKFSPDEVVRLFEHAKLAEGVTWTNSRGDHAATRDVNVTVTQLPTPQSANVHISSGNPSRELALIYLASGLHMASKPVVHFPVKAAEYAARPVPFLQEWEELWKVWDLVTQQMIPEAELLTKPIKLRNVCLFYLGHIPTFLDMQLAKQTDGKHIDEQYPKIFERGIDPDVDNPEHCHNHSEIPDEWPSKDEILAFQDKVRNKVRNYYKTNKAYEDRKIARALWLGHEHEIMHLETLLYMLIQSEKTLPPNGIVRPDFEAMAYEAKVHTVANEWFSIPERDITIGLNDPENDDGPDRYFGWDNEKPPRKTHVPSFQAKARPITNGEYAEYLEKTHQSKLPASWATSEGSTAGAVNGHTNGNTNGHTEAITNGVANGNAAGQPSTPFLEGKAIRTVFGDVPLQQAVTWPAIASYDELQGCAQWLGGRIPTADEAHSIYEYAAMLKGKEVTKAAVNIPAVNSHLLNNGVHQTPPETNGFEPPKPHDHFFDLDGANVGFKRWHPIPVTQNGNKLGGQGDMGGVWEWTSTALDKHEGFEPMKLYPVYTADFFDGKHNIVLGGSWATHPRIAGRKTFVNWYQRNYPYVWAGARVVRDN